MNYEEARALLETPGSIFELGNEIVRGQLLPVFKQRERSMREKVQNAALVHGDKPFLADHNNLSISYKQFAELCWGSGHALCERHRLEKGDRIGILAYNRPEWLIALFGAASVGGVVVGLNGFWHSEEIGYALRDSGCRYLIVDEHLYDRVAPIIGSIEHLEKIFYIGENPPDDTIGIDSLLVARSDIPTAAIDEDDPFVILYTSGTTGRSKGCITTQRGTIAQVQGIIHNIWMNLAMRGPDAMQQLSANPLSTLLTSPLFHVAGLHSTVCSSLTFGTKLVFGPPKFEPEAVLELMQRERITTWMAIPTLLQRLIDHPRISEYDLSALLNVSTGGAPASPELLQKVGRVLPTKPVAGATYGLTECHGMATSISDSELEQKKGSVGRPTPMLEIKIVDAHGKRRAPGESGEICLRGVTITPGYWNREDATAETIRDGWLHTGDVGHLDEDGYLYISDRQKDMILRGGENVYCVEIENCISDHPEIEEAAVIGVPDRDLGERVKAIVRRRADSEIDELKVMAHVASHLARFKVPEIIEFIEQPLPRNPAGKILKNVLRGKSKAPFEQGQL